MIYSEAIRNLFRRPFTRRYPREGIKPYQRSREEIVYHSEKCIGCRRCEMSCPSKCIKFFEKGKIYFDQGACLFCGFCKDVCPVSAIEFNQRFESAGRNKKGFVRK